MTTDAHTTEAATAQDRVLAVVRSLIAEVVGEDYLLDLDIGMDTSFEDDLEMESIEFVKLGARLTEHYGGAIDFASFLADKELDEIIEMRVGAVVNHIVEATS